MSPLSVRSQSADWGDWMAPMATLIRWLVPGNALQRGARGAWYYHANGGHCTPARINDSSWPHGALQRPFIKHETGGPHL